MSFQILIGFLVCFFASTLVEARLGACGDRPLPRNKIRKLKTSSIRLECSAGVDHFVRLPQVFHGNKSYNEWADIQDPVRRQLYRLDPETHPDIVWSGYIGYQTIEKWTWVDWVFGPDPSCGYDEVTTCTTNSDGTNSCTTYSQMRSCFHDETQYESRFCSTEKLFYNAKMLRPRPQGGGPPSDWNPKSFGYYDMIPNKYDLLPGETEVFQTMSNSDLSTKITPQLSIGNAWNDYSANIRFQSGERYLPCEFNKINGIVHSFNVEVETNKRIKKASPNAFALPSGGLEQVLRRSILSSSDQEVGEALYEPNFLKLIDTSHGVILTMSNQSREMEVESEKIKLEHGLGSNELIKNVMLENQKTGFFKDTQVRIRLEEVTNILLFNQSPTKPLYLPGSEISFGDTYELSIYNENNSDKDLYRSKGPFEFLFGSFYDLFRVRLRRDTDYRIFVSMYQKNVPFYNQEEDCGLLSGEGCYYSDELPIEFSIGSKDERTFMQKAYECWSADITQKWRCLKW